MQIQVDGAGFGTAPRTFPATTEIVQFRFIDVAKGGWCAGAVNQNCPVNLQYTSWTDTRISIGGFGPEYGGGNTVASGDAVTLVIQHSGGPQFTIWQGTLP